jgi:hypothetical protein
MNGISLVNTYIPTYKLISVGARSGDRIPRPFDVEDWSDSDHLSVLCAKQALPGDAPWLCPRGHGDINTRSVKRMPSAATRLFNERLDWRLDWRVSNINWLIIRIQELLTCRHSIGMHESWHTMGGVRKDTNASHAQMPFILDGSMKVDDKCDVKLLSPSANFLQTSTMQSSRLHRPTSFQQAACRMHNEWHDEMR